MAKMLRKRSSLQLLIDNERQNNFCNYSYSVKNSNNNCFYISDDEDDDEEGVLDRRGWHHHKRRRKSRNFEANCSSASPDGSPSRWNRRDSYGNPVNFERVAYYEEPGILMIIQSVGVAASLQQQQQQQQQQQKGLTRKH